MDVAVYNAEGNKTSKKVSLSDKVFGIEPNDHAIYLDVKRYLAAQRQGTHKSKERAEIAGSTRKIKKQKGTGTARAGSIKSPVFRGGGRVFGPRPRNYDIKLNKKVKRLARKSALSYKAKEDSIIMLDTVNFGAPKTQDYVKLINNLKLSDSKTLLVLPADDKNVYLSSRNVKRHEVAVASDVHTYQILNSKKLILVEGAEKVLEDLLND